MKYVLHVMHALLLVACDGDGKEPHMQPLHLVLHRQRRPVHPQQP